MKDGGGLEECHHLSIPAITNVKKDIAQDVHLLFSDKVKVKFMTNGKVNTMEGWWCNTCR